MCISILCLASCVSNPGQADRRPTKMIYNGFSIEHPEDQRWSASRGTQSDYHAVFELDVPSPTHSFAASVALSVLGQAPKTPEDLELLVRKSFKVDDTNRFALLAFAVNITTNRGLTGATYTERLLDRRPIGASAPLILVRHGYMTPHPDNPNVILQAMYTERGRKDEINHVEYTSLGKAFLEGVRFERLPR
jgi:hypothetical protein